jgi:hypothetical protein
MVDKSRLGVFLQFEAVFTPTGLMMTFEELLRSSKLGLCVPPENHSVLFDII